MEPAPDDSGGGGGEGPSSSSAAEEAAAAAAAGQSSSSAAAAAAAAAADPATSQPDAEAQPVRQLAIEQQQQGGQGGQGQGQQPSRYESQKRRDWNTFLQYLRNHKPPLSLGRCSGAHVIEFLRYLDQFGKTKVHAEGCPYFGQPSPPAPCACPLRQAWGSLDALIGRLRAAYDESGGRPDSNPFAARPVRIYLREVRESQAKARGIPYEKKKRKRIAAATATSSSPAPSSASAPSSSTPSSTPPQPQTAAAVTTTTTTTSTIITTAAASTSASATSSAAAASSSKAPAAAEGEGAKAEKAETGPEESETPEEESP